MFSGPISLGSFISTTIPDGTTLNFLGFTSDTPITGLTIVATVPGASPNLDIVLDNFLVASPVPEPGTMGLVGLGLLRAGRRATFLPSPHDLTVAGDT
ncbi:hypothetical protein BH18VER2_BH18VER2_09040 [soil metagenome]